MDTPLLVERRDGLGSESLTAGSRDQSHGYCGVDGADGGLDHLAAEVGLGDDAVGLQLVVELDGSSRPTLRCKPLRHVSQYVCVGITTSPSGDDSDLGMALSSCRPKDR